MKRTTEMKRTIAGGVPWGLALLLLATIVFAEKTACANPAPREASPRKTSQLEYRASSKNSLSIETQGAVANDRAQAERNEKALLKTVALAPEGGTVVVPAGNTYYVDGDIDITERVRLAGGGTLRATGDRDYDYVLSLTAARAIAENITIDQSEVTTNAGQGQGLRLVAPDAKAFGVTVIGQGGVGDKSSNCFMLTGRNASLFNSSAIDCTYSGIRIDGHGTNRIHSSRSIDHRGKGLNYNNPHLRGDTLIISGGWYAEITDRVTPIQGSSGLHVTSRGDVKIPKLRADKITIRGNHRGNGIKILSCDSVSIGQIDIEAVHALYGMTMNHVTYGHIDELRIEGGALAVRRHAAELTIDHAYIHSNRYEYADRRNIIHQGERLAIQRAVLKGVEAGGAGIRLEDKNKKETQRLILGDVTFDAKDPDVTLIEASGSLWPGRIVIEHYTIQSGNASITGSPRLDRLILR